MFLCQELMDVRWESQKGLEVLGVRLVQAGCLEIRHLDQLVRVYLVLLEILKLKFFQLNLLDE